MPDSAAAPVAKARLKAQDYVFSGQFDRGKLTTAFAAGMAGAAKFDAKSLTGFVEMIELLERDKDVTDIRWMAYMLATAHWETASIVSSKVPAKNKKGALLTDKHGKPVMKALRSWKSMQPVNETGRGKGRRYYLPVKVTELGDGSVTVIEQDGDEFTVAATGASRLVRRGTTADSKQGVLPTAVVSEVYSKDTGTELAYFGRGYVQLTWWENYAMAGAAIGLGLALLLEPDRALEPDVAYRVMSHGMRTGKGFANGRKLVHYIQGETADYAGARAMVNLKDPQPDIVLIAQRFESILLEAMQR
jgi:hypothetical protein